MRSDGMNELLLLARNDLAVYCAAMWPGYDFAPHLRMLVEHFEAIERGECDRFSCSMPPRHGKTLTTELFVAWYLGKHPERYVVAAGYAQEICDDFGRRVRNFILDDKHKAVFPECQIAADSTSVQRFNLKAGGSFYAVGRGAALTGRGMHLGIADDLFKDRAEATSDAIRRSVHAWYRDVFYTRQQPGAAVCLVGTRWSEADIQGSAVREQPERWRVLNCPAIAEANDVLGRQEGEALWPSRYPRAVLDEIRSTIGSAAFVSLYQGRPSAVEGTVFRRNWIRTYRDIPTAFKKIIQSWDTAFKTGAENDFSVCSTWATTDTCYYLLALWRGRVEFPALKKQVANHAAEWKPSAILVEDKASGQSLIQEIKAATRFPVLAVKVDSDKRTRAEAITPLFEAGKVFLPESAPWLESYTDELASFDAGVHDDQVDSTTQALNYLRGASRCYGFLELGRMLQSREILIDDTGAMFHVPPPPPKAPAPDDAPRCPRCGGSDLRTLPAFRQFPEKLQCVPCKLSWPTEATRRLKETTILICSS